MEGSLTGEAAAKLRRVSSDETNDLALLQISGMFNDVAKGHRQFAERHHE